MPCTHQHALYSFAYLRRGISKYELEDYSGAIADYTKSIELDPNNANTYNNRGNLLTRLEEYNLPSMLISQKGESSVLAVAIRR